MPTLRYTFLADGSSDRALMKIIDWAIYQILPDISIDNQYADLGHLRKPPPLDRLDLRIQKAIELFPCDILFIHRDCERRGEANLEIRLEEIREGFAQSQISKENKLVRIVPIRMMEAWLLVDSNAIKAAAGNRNYRDDLNLPALRNLESIPDPKVNLHSLLKQASGKRGRNLVKFNVYDAVYLVAEYTRDFSNLRALSAYQRFEEELLVILNELNFN